MAKKTAERARSNTLSTPAPVSKFPSVESLFSDSFDLFTKSLKQIIILSLLTLGISFSLAIVLIIAVVVSGFLGVGLAHGIPNLASLAFLPLGVLIFIVILAFILLSFISKIGSLIILNQPNIYTIGQIMKKSLGFILPFLALSILSFILIMPLFFLFVIPGIVVSILLSFSIYELVFNNRGVLGSMRRSVYVVKNHFWSILGRSLIFFGLSIVILVVGFVLSIYLKGTGSLLLLPFNLFLGFYALPYSVTLYKQAEAATADKQKESSLIWLMILWIMSVLLTGFVIVSVFNAVTSNPQIKNVIMRGFKSSDNSTNPALSSNASKQVYKNTFLESCRQSAGANSKYCGCIADYLLNNYSMSQLIQSGKNYKNAKTTPPELTKAATYCVTK